MEEAPPDSSDIEVEPRGSSGNVRDISVFPYHHYTGLWGVVLA